MLDGSEADVGLRTGRIPGVASGESAGMLVPGVPSEVVASGGLAGADAAAFEADIIKGLVSFYHKFADPVYINGQFNELFDLFVGK